MVSKTLLIMTKEGVPNNYNASYSLEVDSYQCLSECDHFPVFIVILLSICIYVTYFPASGIYELQLKTQKQREKLGIKVLLAHEFHTCMTNKMKYCARMTKRCVQPVVSFSIPPGL